MFIFVLASEWFHRRFVSGHRRFVNDPSTFTSVLTCIFTFNFNKTQMNSNIQDADTKRLNSILSDITKSYFITSAVFHEYFKRMLDISLRTSLHLKDKYLNNIYNVEYFYSFIDHAVNYRIGTVKAKPNKCNFVYSFTTPYSVEESLDDILDKIMYSAYPVEVLVPFKNNLDSFIHDDRIVNIVLSKLDTRVIV